MKEHRFSMPVVPVAKWTKADRDAWLLDLCEAHWEAMRDGTAPDREMIVSEFCPLCEEYIASDCQGCPINVKGIICSHEDSPWKAAAGAVYSRIDPDGWRAACQPMIAAIRDAREAIQKEVADG